MIETKSLDKALCIEKNEIVLHPIFGRLKVEFIFKNKQGILEITCILLDFNNTVRVYDALELNKIKFRKEIRELNKNDLKLVK